MHTGCLYSPSPHPPTDVVSSFKAFGIDLIALKLSSHPHEGMAPDMSSYLLKDGGGTPKPQHQQQQSVKAELKTKIKTETLDEEEEEFNSSMYACEVQLDKANYENPLQVGDDEDGDNYEQGLFLNGKCATHYSFVATLTGS